MRLENVWIIFSEGCLFLSMFVPEIVVNLKLLFVLICNSFIKIQKQRDFYFSYHHDKI